MNGAELIAAERLRQIEVEGWTPEHDAHHATGALSLAAYCYLAQALRLDDSATLYWPWDWVFWKPAEDPVRNLVKAGALIVAEIDRLQQEGRGLCSPLNSRPSVTASPNSTAGDRD